MSTEDRLRRALTTAAEAHEPDPRGLERIEEKLMDQRRFSPTQKWALGGAAAAAVLLVVVVLASVLAGDDGGDDKVIADEPSSTTTSTSTTSTSIPTTTETTTTTTAPFTPDVDPYEVAFPSPADSRRFDSPETAAQAFATDVLGFTRLEVGAFRAGDSRSGEVPIKARSQGPETAVLVRQMADDTWFVLGATTGNIAVETPATGEALTSPFTSTGQSLAFEGVVNVMVLAQGEAAPLGEGIVMGPGTPPAGPFEGTITFSPPGGAVPGLVVYRTLSAEDGHVEEAATVRVRLGDGTAPASVGCGAVDDADASAGERLVQVWFHCGDVLTAATRTIPAGDPAILTHTMEVLLEGPTATETDAGFTSVFPVPGGEVLSVIINGGVATVNLSDEVADGVQPTSNTIGVLSSEVHRTATQFASVSGVRILFDGSCDAYASWAESDSCVVEG